MTLKPLPDLLAAAGQNCSKISKTIVADLVHVSVQADFNPFKKHLSLPQFFLPKVGNLCGKQLLQHRPVIFNPLFCLTMPKRQHFCTTMDVNFVTWFPTCCVIQIMTYVRYGMACYFMLCHVMICYVMVCYVIYMCVSVCCMCLCICNMYSICMCLRTCV